MSNPDEPEAKIFTAETPRRREINEKSKTIQFYNPLFFLSASAVNGFSPRGEQIYPAAMLLKLIIKERFRP
ncbi:MAG: hypothetical protein WC091_14865 [Sulfuricellaceae bacterium]